jgi:hypothetical protein
VYIRDFLKSREQILKNPCPKISRKEQTPDFERLKMEMVEGFGVEDEPLQFLDMDKASEEADRVSKETIFASEEARKGGGDGKMEIEKREGEEEAIAGFLLQVGRE